MTVRQRPASDVGIPATANGTAHGQVVKGVHSTPSRWEDWFYTASPAQRAEALAIAHRQGVLCLQDLPCNGVGTSTQPQDIPLRATLITLLAGKEIALPNAVSEKIDWAEPRLTEVEKSAVQRALATPDLCLFELKPEADSTRALVELILQSARRNSRTLVLAESTGGLDRLLEPLSTHPELLPLRFLAETENQAEMPEWLQVLTLSQQRKVFLERTLTGARQNVVRAEEACTQRCREAEIWTHIHSASRDLAAIQRKILELDANHARLEAEVNRDAEVAQSKNRDRDWDLRATPGPFSLEYLSLLQTQEAARCSLIHDIKLLAEKRISLNDERNRRDQQLQAVESDYQIKKAGRWWTGAYWRVTWSGFSLAEVDKRKQDRLQIDQQLQTLEAEGIELDHRIDHIDEHESAERQACVQNEILRRAGSLATRRELLEAERIAAASLAQRQAEGIADFEHRPTDLSSIAIETAQRAWQAQKQRDEESYVFSKHWLEYLEKTGSDLTERLPEFANVLAAPLSQLKRDPDLMSALVEPCDLLIVESADALSEVDLLQLTAYASRLLLIGRRSNASPWFKLWRTLGGEDRLAWKREAGQLLCQLIPIADEEQGYLETEGLTDVDVIELRILALPQCRPCLAEVVFPSEYSIDQAFAFMIREVGEIPLALGQLAHPLREESQRGILQLASELEPSTSSCEIMPGLRIHFGKESEASPCRALYLEFDYQAGWDPSRAESWLMERKFKDTARTAVLK